MKTSYLTSKYKFPYTPMESDADVIPLYKRTSKETGAPQFEICTTSETRLALFGFLSLTPLDRYILKEKERSHSKQYSEFLSKWDKHKNSFKDFDENFVFNNIKRVIDQLIMLQPKYVTFELTNDGSIFFQSLVNSKNIYFELYFDNSLEAGLEAITNIYQNGACVFAYGGSIENTFSEIFTKVQKHSWVQATPFQSSYELSDKAFAATEL